MKMKRLPGLQPRHRQILGLIREKLPHMLVAMVCMLVISGTTACSAYLVKPVLDDVFIRKDPDRMTLIALVVVVVYLFKGLATYGQSYLMAFVGTDIIRRLRNELYNRIQDMPVSFFQHERTGALMSRVTYDVSIVRNMVTNVVSGSIKDTFTIIFLMGVTFYQIWDLAMVSFFILPVAFYPIYAFGRKVRKFSTGCQESMGEMNAFLHETFAGNKIVKAFGMEAFEKKRFFERSYDLFRLQMKEERIRAISSPFMEFLGGMAIAFMIWFGGSRVIDGILTPGTFMSFLAAVIMMYEPVKKLTKLNNAIQQGLAATDRIFDVIDTPADIRDPEEPQQVTGRECRVTFKDVSFAYEEETVLHHIDLEVGNGDILALAGASGGGKTTLVNLIPRFFDVSRGSVAINGIDIRRLGVAHLRSLIAIVTQEPILFNDTVRNNIAYGNMDASEQDIEEAAHQAYAYDFIQGFPKGFDTNIGELGGRLSGGEKQRICIARALLKNAPILILDEATSSLDTEAESLVQKALENLMRGRTTFVIAHRMSTIRHAGQIVVLLDGRIQERGTHEQLLAQGGEYRKLFTMQFGTDQTRDAAGA
jgi:subfamily B ATP-binding cassette protein MsbA